MTTVPAPPSDAFLGRPPAASRLAVAVAVALFVVTEASVAAAVVSLAGSGLPLRLLITSYGATNGWLAATFAPFGAVVAAKRPRSPIGWLFGGFALAYGVSSAAISLALRQVTTGHPAAWMSTVGWIGLWAWTPAVSLCFPLILALFPDGVLPSPRWRWLVAAAALDGILWPLSVAVDSSTTAGVPFITHPPVVVSGTLASLAADGKNLGNITLGVMAVVSLGLLFWRWQHAAGRRRAQLSWLLGGAVVACILFSPQEFNINSLWAVSMIVGVPILPVAATVALLRHRLLDLDVIINRTIVYVLLSGTLLLAYLGVSEAVRALIGGGTGVATSVPAAAVVAVLFAPARQWL